MQIWCQVCRNFVPIAGRFGTKSLRIWHQLWLVGAYGEEMTRIPNAGMRPASGARGSSGPGEDAPGLAGARQRLGARGEQLAAAHLERLGYRILARNHRTRWGELDLIAQHEGLVAFVEVKTRRASGASGTPFEAVDHRKRAQVRRMAASWLATEPNRPHADQLRFDVIGVTMDGAGRLLELEHREGVF
jgi:putative endonuclease